MYTLETLPEDATPEQIMQLDRASLDLIPFESRFWVCQCKRCGNGTRIRDYGMAPWYLLERGSKQALKNPQKYWINIQKTFNLCGKHWVIYHRLLLKFPTSIVQQKLLDYKKDPVQTSKPNQKKPIEK